MSAFAGGDRVVTNASGEWTRILAPLPAAAIPGANGSFWRTEIHGLIDATTFPEMLVRPCGPVEDPCSFTPLNKLFDAAGNVVYGGNGPQFVYIASEDASKLTLSTRVYDTSQALLTAGATVPMPRDKDFSSEGFSLIAIPVLPAYRSMLRIYDATGVNGREVELTLYLNDETTPIVRETVRLVTVDEQIEVTPDLLPRYPAMAQIDLSALLPEQRAYVRVTVRPLGSNAQSGSQLWGFATATNNQTSHVTVIAP